MKYYHSFFGKTEIVDAEQFWPDSKPWPRGVIKREPIDNSHGLIRHWANAGFFIPIGDGLLRNVAPGDYVWSTDDGVFRSLDPESFLKYHRLLESV